MSTRATILIRSEKEDEQVRIYHHFDGYPSGVGADLKEYLGGLGNWWTVERIANDLVKGKCGSYVNNEGKELKDDGYEFTTCQHGDEEYAYLIDCDNKDLTCYKIGWDDFDWPKESKEVEIP